MFKKKKILATLAASGLLAATALSGTLAYFTSTESATNTFTVGDVKIDLIDKDWPGNESSAVKAVLPFDEVASSPYIKNTGTNKAVVFMSVEIPVGTTVDDEYIKDLVWYEYSDTEKSNSYNGSNWINIVQENGAAEGDVTRYVFGYTRAIDINEETNPLFNRFQLKNVSQDTSAEEALDIKINAYAIQASSIKPASLSDKSVDFSNADIDYYHLQNIYNRYIEQEGVDSIDADGHNSYNYDGTANN